MDSDFSSESYGLKVSAIVINCFCLVAFGVFLTLAMMKIKCNISRTALILLSAYSACKV